MAIKIKKKAAISLPEPAPVKKPEKAEHGKVLDGMCRAAIKLAPMSVVPWWLMASYTYYIHDMSMLSDGLYDEMAKDMLARWDEIEHMHKHLIQVSDLQTGSLYRMKAGEYPGMTKGAASHLLRGEWGVKLPID